MRTPDLDEQLDRLEGICPAFLAKTIHFLARTQPTLAAHELLASC